MVTLFPYPKPGASPWLLDLTFSLLPCCVSCLCVSFSFLVFSSTSVLGSTLCTLQQVISYMRGLINIIVFNRKAMQLVFPGGQNHLNWPFLIRKSVVWMVKTGGEKSSPQLVNLPGTRPLMKCDTPFPLSNTDWKKFSSDTGVYRSLGVKESRKTLGTMSAN